MKSKKIHIPIYGGTLKIILVEDLLEVQNKYNTSSLEDFGAVTLKNKSEYREYVVAFTELDRSLIAHEVVHIVNYIFSDSSIELDRINDEPQAYLTGWLFKKIEKFIAKNV